VPQPPVNNTPANTSSRQPLASTLLITRNSTGEPVPAQGWTVRGSYWGPVRSR
jgi:hypothetical protein